MVVYKATFATTPDRWEVIEVPFTDFFRVTKGQVAMDFREFSMDDIDRIGFIMSERKDGPFELKVDYIKLIPNVEPLSDTLSDRKKSLMSNDQSINQ
eukprot:gene13892-16388_t